MFSRVPSLNAPAASHHSNHLHLHHQYDLTTTATTAAASLHATTYDPLATSAASATAAIHAAALTVDDEEFNRLSGDPNWWQNAIEEDSFDSPLPFDASESGLWNGRFVPPPPRPPFLDESIATDGLTTCDLCTWAWHDRNTFSLDASIGEAAGELGWAFTLIIVSVISALLGAIIMVIVLRCRRLKTSNANGGRPLPWWSRGGRNPSGGVGVGGGSAGRGGGGGGGVNRSNMTIKQSADSIRSAASLHNNPGVWTWLGQRRQSASPDHHHHHNHHHHQMGAPASSPAENHYTHMDDSYSPVGLGSSGSGAGLGGGGLGGSGCSMGPGGRSGGGGGGGSGGDEALYAELDRESIRSANPSYQNTAYSQCGEHDADVPIVSSAPSSAYYSDLSTTGTATTTNDRGYEVVGMTHMSQPMPSWDSSEHGSNGRRPPRLAAINETSTTTLMSGGAASALTASVPSDYV